MRIVSDANLPLFLPLDKVLEIHDRQIRLHGGDAAVRSVGLLESAAAAPASGIGDRYFHAFPFEMAAAYLFYLVKDHPFVDGNKRTGAVSALAFLSVNGYCLDAAEADLERITRAVAASEIPKPQITAFFEHYCNRRLLENR